MREEAVYGKSDEKIRREREMLEERIMEKRMKSELYK